MNNIEYIKEDLVQLQLTSLFEYKLHACNTLGKWGRGIAKAFAEHYPTSYHEYAEHCNLMDDISILGEPFITSENIICLMTSKGYSPPDIELLILVSTAKALSHLGGILPRTNRYHIYSNRFNSGLFNVPWEHTEALVEQLLAAYPNIKWTVCDPK